MKIESAEFSKSVTSASGLPAEGVTEIAFVGRSNVGKSSMLNALTQRKGLARTSNTPGKTREINFFSLKVRAQGNVQHSLYFVDLPGYGYAKVSKSQQEAWQELLAAYLKEREQLKLVVLLVDSRHPQMPSDLEMQEFLYFYGRRFAIVRTKVDKLKRAELEQAHRDSEAFFGGYEFITDFSAVKGTGKTELLTKLDAYIF